MENLALFWVYDKQEYVNIANTRTNIGYSSVEKRIYNNATAYAIALNGVTDLKNRLNKELVFTNEKLAYIYMVNINSKINDNILSACE